MSKYAKSVILDMLRESFGEIHNVDWLGKGVSFEVDDPCTHEPPIRIERRNFTLHLIHSGYNPGCMHTYRIDTML